MFSHIMVGSTDIERSKRFYDAVLGVLGAPEPVRNLNATGGNWQLIYSLAQRFKLRAQAGADNAMDLIFQWRWD